MTYNVLNGMLHPAIPYNTLIVFLCFLVLLLGSSYIRFASSKQMIGWEDSLRKK